MNATDVRAGAWRGRRGVRLTLVWLAPVVPADLVPVVDRPQRGDLDLRTAAGGAAVSALRLAQRGDLDGAAVPTSSLMDDLVSSLPTRTP